MIYTVFPKKEGEPPQDFSTFEEAVEYAETLDCDYAIESTTGSVE